MRGKSITDLTQEYLPLLEDKENQENLKILEATEIPGCKAGDNFMSLIIRTELKGIYRNGNPFEKSLITKIHPTNGDKFVSFVRTRDLFWNEEYSYYILLPAIKVRSLVPECYHASSEKIVMEDLARDNFSICNRQNLLDYGHCRHVLQALAQFHAASLKVKLNNPDYFKSLIKPIKEIMFPEDPNAPNKKMLDTSLNLAIQSLETIEPPTGRSQKCLKFLKKYLNRAYDIVKKSAINQSSYNVLVHGDIWKNNIFFSNDNMDQENMRIKFVDFQAIRHASPALDFHYFMYSSAKSTVLENNYGDLIQLYHKTLLNELQFKIPKEHYVLINFDWFEREIHKHAVYGLFFTLSLVHVILADDGAIKVSMSENGQETNTKVPITPIKTERIETIVSHFIRTFGDIE